MKRIMTTLKTKHLVSFAVTAACLISLVLVVAFAVPGRAAPLAATAPGLGVAGSFAVLGGSTVTNTGPSVINGDLGVWPGLAITGFPPGSVVPPGVIHAGDAVAQQAQSDVTTAYNALAGQACDFNLTGQDLSGMTLTPGVYCFDTSAQLTGTLTLNAQGDPNAVWVFQMGSTITTASNSSVAFINGGAGVPGCNVFWQVGSSATLGTTTNFVGNILALASITMNTGANIYGSTLARNGAVTLDTNTITKSSCATVQNSLVLAKNLTGGPVGYTGPFNIHWDCGTFGSGDKSVFAGDFATVPNIPSGTSCTVSETPPTAPTGYSFGTPTFSPSATVTIPAGSGSSITVTTNNTLTHDQGYLKISKVFSNPAYTGNFHITYLCTDALATSGSVDIAGGATSNAIGPIDTYNGATAVTCGFDETPPANPTGYTFGTPTFNPTSKSVTITKGLAANAVVATVTNTLIHDQGYFKISKVFSNPAYTGNFHITYLCTDALAASGSVDIAGGATSNAIGPIDTYNGATAVTCGFDETPPANPTGYTFGTPTFNPTSKSVTITKGLAANAVVATVTNTLIHDQGYFKISKVFSNPAYTGNFHITYLCTDALATSGSVDIAGGATSNAIGPIDTYNGATAVTCGFDETPPANPTGYTFGTPTFNPTSKSVTITKGLAANAVVATVTNTLIHDQGYFKISKVFSNPAYTGNFHITYLCTDALATSGSVDIAGGATSNAIGPIDTYNGATAVTCGFDETPPANPTGYTFGTPTFNPTSKSVTITKGLAANAVVATVTNTLTRDLGNFKITKSVSNPNGANLPEAFTGTYNCGVGYTGNFSVAPTSFTTLASAVAAGATNVKVISVTGVTVGKTIMIDTGANSETVTVTAVGTAGAGGTGITFTPALALAHASGASVTIYGSQTISGIPTGNTCSVVETAPAPITGFTWGPITYTPTSIVISTKGGTFEIVVGNSINLISILKIDVEKYIKNGVGAWQEADTPTGPYLNPGVNPQFKFVVTNIGNVTLTFLTLNDNVLNLSGCTIPETLAPNASFECLVTGTWAAGQHTNTATATGKFNAALVSDTDNANYFGVVPVVSKTANGSYQEVHDWKVFKSVDIKSQNAYAGQKVEFTWKINVGETVHGENHLVTGVITVVNPNPDDAMTLSLNDTLDDGAVATIGPCTGGTWNSPNLTVPKGSTAICNYTVTPKGALGELTAALPDTVTMNIQEGSNSLFDITISNDGSLNGTHEGWCADPNHGIQFGKDYVANVFSSYESLPAGLVDHPENFDLVNWIINQYFVGKSAGGGLGNYTVGDVQQAIWELLSDNVSVSISYDRGRVDQIKALAATHEGFKPTCGDLVAVILQPLDGKQISIIQVTFASLGVDCAKSNAVLAVLNGFKFPATADIVWTATPVNPTATLDDDQNPAFPKTVSADATFTYKDNYTCPASAATYANGPTTYTRNNKAVLTFATGSVSSSASTSVKCDAYMPALTLVKIADPLTYSQVGDVIDYSYLVKNTGNVDSGGSFNHDR